MWHRKTLALLACAVLFAAGAVAAFILGRERLAQSLLASARENLAKPDYPAALDELDRLLELKPDSAMARLMRAEARLNLEDYAGALEDADRACALQPDTPIEDGLITARHFRAYIRGRNGDLAGAYADAGSVLEHDPSNRAMAAYRAALCHDMGDSAGALAEFERITGMGVFSPTIAFSRGRARFALGDYQGAAEDFHTAYEYGEAFAGIWLALAQRFQGRQPATPPALGLTFEKDWDAALYGHIQGTTSEAQLFELAGAAPDAFEQRGRLCEAWFYAGMLKLKAGDRAGAADYFRRAMAVNRTDYIEHWESSLQLRALEQGDKVIETVRSSLTAPTAAP